MAFVNLKNKEIQVKIVYYGPGRGGKTTNLEYIYKKYRNRINTKKITGQDTIDFIEYRKRLAAGDPMDTALMAAVLGKPKE